MAIHFIRTSDNDTGNSLCGRKNVNSGTIGSWDGVTCKQCFKKQVKLMGYSVGQLRKPK